MRRFDLLLASLQLLLVSSAYAAPCCPAGCVQTPISVCGRVPIRAAAHCSHVAEVVAEDQAVAEVGTQTGVVFPRPAPPPCFPVNSTPAARNAATDQCVSSLSANAQLLGCFFEDNAGRAEDARTGLSCPAREAALANQCRGRCAVFASSLFTCSDPNAVWQTAFGSIGGILRISARGPLRTAPARWFFYSGWTPEASTSYALTHPHRDRTTSPSRLPRCRAPGHSGADIRRVSNRKAVRLA